MRIRSGLYTTIITLLFISFVFGQIPSPVTPESTSPVKTKMNLPRMVDYGADKCVPCKAMAPILKELQSQYKDQVEVVFVDVWKDRTAGQKVGIKLIPTQIFYDASGKEVARHEGFISREDILNELRKHKFLPAENK